MQSSSELPFSRDMGLIKESLIINFFIFYYALPSQDTSVHTAVASLDSSAQLLQSLLLAPSTSLRL
jgi:hypothetical protein